MPGLKTQRNAYLSLFIACDPFIPLDPSNIPIEESFENMDTRAYAKYWKEKMQKCPGNFLKQERDYQAMTLDVQSTLVLITRYVKPCPPPPELLFTTGSVSLNMRQLARFVSMIPSVPDDASFIGNTDMWSTSEEFLKMLSGDQEEHAILLCNLLLSLAESAGSANLEAYLVLGYGIPDGPTVYVLTKHTPEDNEQYTMKRKQSASNLFGGNSRDPSNAPTDSVTGAVDAVTKFFERPDADAGKVMLLWNATTGESYPVSHSFCPLQRIDVIFDGTNIWGNQQMYDEPTRMKYDFKNAKDWGPFYSKNFMPATRLPSVQKPIVFEMPGANVSTDLELRIEQFLRKKIRTWREARRKMTRFNPLCCNELKLHLQDYERAVIDPTIEPQLTEKLTQVNDKAALVARLPSRRSHLSLRGCGIGVCRLMVHQPYLPLALGVANRTISNSVFPGTPMVVRAHGCV